MKKRTLITSAALFILLCLMIGRAEISYADKEDTCSVQIAFATDLHYLSPKLTDKGSLFQYIADRNAISSISGDKFADFYFTLNRNKMDFSVTILRNALML